MEFKEIKETTPEKVSEERSIQKEIKNNIKKLNADLIDSYKREAKAMVGNWVVYGRNGNTIFYLSEFIRSHVNAYGALIAKFKTPFRIDIHDSCYVTNPKRCRTYDIDLTDYKIISTVEMMKIVDKYKDSAPRLEPLFMSIISQM